MTQLAATVDADDEVWTLDALPSTRYVQVADEQVEVRSPFPSQTYTLTGQDQPPRIRVRRGVGGTTAVGHNSGSALTPIYGLGAGEGSGGAIAVDNTVDPPAEVTTLVVAGAVIDGTEATLPGILLTGGETSTGNFFRGPDDPADTPAYLAILEPGDQWTQTGNDLEPAYPMWQRNANDDGWEVTGQVFVDGAGKIRAVNKIQSDGVVILEVRDTDGIAVISTLRIEADGLVKLYASGVPGTGPTIDLSPATGDVDIGGGSGGLITLNAFGGAAISIGALAALGGDVSMVGLPTADPTVAGQLWNNSGVLMVSAG